jgi:hypothetical protein
MGASAHGPDCDCPRCTGFPKGHSLSLRHGGYAVVRLAPRAAELAAQIRESLPVCEDADAAAVELLGLVLARIEAASAALAGDGAGSGGERVEPAARLESDLRGWVSTARRLMGDLAMTPSSRARLARDLGLGAHGAVQARAALEKYLAERYGERDGEGEDG